MKVLKKNLLKVVLCLSLFIFVPITTLFAFDNMQSGEVVLLSKDSTINSDYFAAGENVTVSGTVNGDAYLAGGKINVDGTINGDLIVAGGNVNIRGNVLGNVRSVGGQINISGNVGRNVSIGGGSVNLSDTATVKGSVAAGGGDLNIYSPVGGDITAGAGNLLVGNFVGGNIYAGVSDLVLASGAKVTGNINYWSDKDGRVEQGAQILGNTTRFPANQNPHNKAGEDFGKFMSGVSSIYRIATIISALILGLLLIRFAPNFTRKTADQILKSPGKTFLTGLIALIVVPVIFIILMITVIGIPIALMLIALYLVLISFSKIIVAIVFGQKILEMGNKKTSMVWCLIIGLIIYGALITLPVVGFIASMLVTIFGLGALLLEKKKYYQILREKNQV